MSRGFPLTCVNKCTIGQSPSKLHTSATAISDHSSTQNNVHPKQRTTKQNAIKMCFIALTFSRIVEYSRQCSRDAYPQDVFTVNYFINI